MALWVEGTGPILVGDMVELPWWRRALVLVVDRFHQGSINEVWLTVQPCSREGKPQTTCRLHSLLAEKDGKVLVRHWTKRRRQA